MRITLIDLTKADREGKFHDPHLSQPAIEAYLKKINGQKVVPGGYRQLPNTDKSNGTVIEEWYKEPLFHLSDFQVTRQNFEDLILTITAEMVPAPRYDAVLTRHLESGATFGVRADRSAESDGSNYYKSIYGFEFYPAFETITHSEVPEEFTVLSDFTNPSAIGSAFDIKASQSALQRLVSSNAVLYGEYGSPLKEHHLGAPMSDRLSTVNPERISHCITDLTAIMDNERKMIVGICGKVTPSGPYADSVAETLKRGGYFGYRATERAGRRSEEGVLVDVFTWDLYPSVKDQVSDAGAATIDLEHPDLEFANSMTHKFESLEHKDGWLVRGKIVTKSSNLVVADFRIGECHLGTIDNKQDEFQRTYLLSSLPKWLEFPENFNSRVRLFKLFITKDFPIAQVSLTTWLKVVLKDHAKLLTDLTT